MVTHGQLVQEPPRRGHFLDLTGQRFNRLLVTSFAGKYKPHRVIYWNARCDCGAEVLISTQALRTMKIPSCGCAFRDFCRKRQTTHGGVGTKEYRCWNNMKNRCLKPSNKDYPDYGGRGITIHSAWISSFEQFLAGVGQAPGPKSELDRINNDGNYEPTNVRWTGRTTQLNNTRVNRIVEFNGKRTTVAQLCRETGLPRSRIDGRLRHSWGVEDAVSKPKQKRTNTTLNEIQVAEIRRLKGTATQRSVAEAFGVSRTLIRYIWKGRIWKDVV